MLTVSPIFSSPPSSGSKPTMVLNNVDLPTPLGPMTPTIPFLGREKVKIMIVPGHNDIDFGTVADTGIPRYLDLGQCNDSNGAVHIALAISEALNTPVNDLPIAIVLSWMEQKAVIILLALFSLGIKNIYLGPKPPQFVNEEILNFLVENFNLHLTGDALSDLDSLLIKAA
jgi:hydroxylamine reductase (hybrid-cluster protein)